jgi:hypothetical protein
MWSVAGHSSAGTSISAAGVLTIAANETATTLTVMATSTVNPAMFGTATVTVATPSPEVLGIAIAPKIVTVQKGATQQFVATVTVKGNADTTVTWSVSGKNSTGTTVSAAGLLTVASDETAYMFFVKATATAANPARSSSATVTVAEPKKTGVEDQLQVAITLYPNPFTDALHLTGAEGCTLRVITASGATAYVRQLASPSETLSLKSLPAGSYFLLFEKDGKTKTLQVVKQ